QSYTARPYSMQASGGYRGKKALSNEQTSANQYHTHPQYKIAEKVAENVSANVEMLANAATCYA
ncbi:hypothetical protein, partial [Flavonifractor plautii]|uniref:hypothetical protein n=1 Tax=Flavonifractor plautii TaxID=292800 RepID=UPI003D7E6834